MIIEADALPLDFVSQPGLRSTMRSLGTNQQRSLIRVSSLYVVHAAI